MKYLVLLLAVGLATAIDLKGVKKTRHIYKRQAGGCLYEGQTYQQGQSWTVPCKYNCQCTDGSTGHYTCKDVCPSYGTLPQGCQLVKEANGCCSKPQCSFTPSGGGFHLGFGTGSQTPVMSGGSGGCVDKLKNCKDYGDAVCTDPTYTSWVTDNCALFCGKCESSKWIRGQISSQYPLSPWPSNQHP
ncbi:WISP1 [Mytilus coruscus]|uniref:WISP1 n=1 Tax=Mytilus coruscus TaxID=42192 RepID=A0A6J8EUI1_MYTCO|nr:WISP1 [Mytilus coruscus]